MSSDGRSIVTRPRPELFELLAGRSFTAGAGVAESADEHRLGGLLLDAIEAGTAEVTRDDLRTLTAADLGTEAHHRRLWDVIADVSEGLAERGIETAVLKGVVNEARWYQRLAQRPTTDVDLLVSPGHVDRVDEILATYGAAHPAPAEATKMVRLGQLQHVHFEYRGVTIDVHLDPLKLGVPATTAATIWDTTESLARPDGGTVRVLGRPAALLLALLHTNKDRFAYLGSYEEIRRIAQDPAMDWAAIHRLVDAEGLAAPAWCSLAAIATAIDVAPSVPAAGGWRSLAWHRIWPERSRLRGHEGRREGSYKQKLLPALMRGRADDSLAEWRRYLLPPRELLDVHNPDERDHAYVRRVTLDRL